MSEISTNVVFAMLSPRPVLPLILQGVLSYDCKCRRSGTRTNESELPRGNIDAWIIRAYEA